MSCDSDDDSSKVYKANARIYARVSTELQKNAISLDTQIKRCTNACDVKGYKVVGIYKDDGVSGKTLERDQFQKIIKDSKQGDIIVVDELTRFSRHSAGGIQMLERLVKDGIYLYSLSPDIDFSTPMGKAMFTIMMAFGTMEREVTAKKVSDNMRNLSKQGKLRTKAPFGFKYIGKDKDFEVDDEQTEVIKKILKMKREGLSTYKISLQLNEEGLAKTLNNNKTTKNKNPKFHPCTIQAILDFQLSVDENDDFAVNRRIVSRIKGSSISEGRKVKTKKEDSPTAE